MGLMNEADVRCKLQVQAFGRPCHSAPYSCMRTDPGASRTDPHELPMRTMLCAAHWRSVVPMHLLYSLLALVSLDPPSQRSRTMTTATTPL